MNLKERFKKEVLLDEQGNIKKGKKTEYLIGEKNNLLTIVDFRPPKKGTQITWICKCECGNIAYVRSKKHLKKRIGCSSCTSSIVSVNKGPFEHYSYFKKKAKRYKEDALKRHLNFDITYEDCYDLFRGDCYYCGIEPELKSNGFEQYKVSESPLRANGIDRIDSKKGYTKENTVSCCVTCNYGKHKQSKEDFLNWIEKVYMFNFKKQNNV